MVWTVVIEGPNGCWARELNGSTESKLALEMAAEMYGHQGRIIGVVRGAHSTCFFPTMPILNDQLKNDQLHLRFKGGGHEAPPTS
jgi:hypothetical protein